MIIRFYLVAFALLFPVFGFAQPPMVVKNLKTDFGAIGDGVHNDHEAFSNASRFFNDRKGNGTLVLPAGIYIVGRQLDYGALLPLSLREVADGSVTNPYYKLGLPAVFISGCENFTIQGEKGTVIKFGDGLLLGGFDAAGKAIPIKDKEGNNIVPPKSSLALAGDGMYIENSRGITISAIELDGNLEELQLGGNISADGWQGGQTGIAAISVTGLTIENVRVHHFAVDGLQLRNTTHATIAAVTDQDIKLTNSSFDYNGRQGFSWTGGAGLKATGCSFSHTGRGYNKSIGRELSTGPGAGVDIEPESDPNINIFRLIRNGIFDHCIFENNSGAGMVADLYSEAEYRVAQDIIFNDCTFWGTTFWSVWVSHPGFRFNRCRIYGSAVHSFDEARAGMETKFTGCFFEDKPYRTINGTTITPYGSYLVEIANGIKTTFDACTFTSHGKYYYYLVCSDPGRKPNKFVINNCRFLNASGTDRPKNSIAEGVLFTGNNEYLNIAVSK